jgi:hypothetical protein
MNVKELLECWESTAASPMSEEAFSIRLPVEDVARVRALADMYPRRVIDEIISELLSAALNDVESHLPYRKGSKVIGVDEEGDPLYEDIGPTPRYLSLTDKYRSELQQLSKSHH